MSRDEPSVDRRTFIKAGAGAAGLGVVGSAAQDSPAAEAALHLPLKTAEAREVASVCPYCAVGCGQLVSVRDGRIVNIEGNPASPINEGTLCPKGAATYQLVVNPQRITTVRYRRPGGTSWEDRTLDWTMDRIARLVQQTRDATFCEWWETMGPDGRPVRKRVNHTLAIASLGGATIDNEWNYLQAKLLRALGVVAIENQART